MRRYPYFKPAQLCTDGTPAPAFLQLSVERAVRFEEVDSMGIVWHGRYPSYFEDARVALGEHFGIGYSACAREKIPAPVKQMYIDYSVPLHFGQVCTITVRLYWSEAARMNYSYIIHDDGGVRTTTGYTVQMFISQTGEFLMAQPKFYADFCQRWKNGTIC